MTPGTKFPVQIVHCAPVPRVPVPGRVFEEQTRLPCHMSCHHSSGSRGVIWACRVESHSTPVGTTRHARAQQSCTASSKEDWETTAHSHLYVFGIPGCRTTRPHPAGLLTRARPPTNCAPHGFRTGSRRVPDGFQTSSRRVPAWFQTGSRWVPDGFRTSSRRVPDGFGTGSAQICIGVG